MANVADVEIYIKMEKHPCSDLETLIDVNKEAMGDNKCEGMSNQIKIEEAEIKSQVLDTISGHNVKQEPEDVSPNEPEEYLHCNIKVENLPELPPYASDGEDLAEGTVDSQCSRDNVNSLKKVKVRRGLGKDSLNKKKEQDEEGMPKGRKRKKRHETRLTGREKARRYREKLKLNPVKEAERLKKNREIYHKTKKLVSSMNPQEQAEAREIWKIKKKAQRQKKDSTSDYASWLTAQCHMKPFIW